MSSAPAPSRGPAPPASAPDTALLIVDMISDWAFDDAPPLLSRTQAIAPCIAALKARCTAAGLPTIYANDNHGRWRSDFRQVVERCLAQGGAAAAIGRQLAPEERDFFVLKPKHSAFFCTPLELLLQHLSVRRLIVCGVAGDQCVLLTAGAAHMRGYEVAVPADCIASQTEERHERSLRHFQEALHVDTRPSGEQALRGAR